MPLTTTAVALTRDAWTVLAEASTQVICQNQGSGAACVYVGAAAPTGSSPYIVLGGNARESSIALDSLTTEKVYGRGLHGNTSVTIVKD